MARLSIAKTREYRQNHIYAMHQLAPDLWCPLNRDYMPLDDNWLGHGRPAGGHGGGYGVNKARTGEYGHGGAYLSNEAYAAVEHLFARKVVLTPQQIEQVAGEHSTSVHENDGGISLFFLYDDGSVPWFSQDKAAYDRRESTLKGWLDLTPR